MIKTRSFIAGLLLFLAATVVAAARTQAPAQAPIPASSAHAGDIAELRNHIFVMEGALQRAVAAGARDFNKEIRSFVPNMMMLTGEPQARGVYLDGYGVYFDVGVPILGQSMVWSIGPMLQQNDLDQAAMRALRASVLPSMKPGPERAALEAYVARQELQQGFLSRAATGERVANPLQGRVQVPGATVSETVPAAPPQPAPSSDLGVTIDRLQDPNAINQTYTEAVKKKLIDVMIEFSLPMRLGPDEWLTVGARDNMQRDSLATATDPYEEVVTILLRIKGSDLAAYREQKIDGAEVRRRVQVREF